MADAMVLATQKWLNEKYGNDSRFNKVAEDGITGWGTIYGLRRALQIEEKLPSLSNNFGQSTYAKCPTVKKGDTGNLVYIVQGGLWCKGYSPGGFNGVYGDGTYAAVQRFKKAAGFDDADGNIDKDFMKALLDMSAFKLLSGGKEEIRTIQQQLNKDYYDFYQNCPCNGLYDRDMNKMLIYALQKEEGIPKASATGTWGPSTISKCPALKVGDSSKVVKLVRYALVCNGFSVSTSSEKYDSTLDEVAEKFAKSLKINKANTLIGYTIIKSLLSSNGDPNRSALGCDTATKLTKAQIQTIKKAGYKYVGRYLTNTPGGTLDKCLTQGEISRICAANLRIIPIFQENGRSVSNFTTSTGNKNGNKAYNAAKKFKIPNNTVIYFAVDFDATDSEITKGILPYFKALLSSSVTQKYRVGAYGTRNVCNRLNNELGINHFYVADASYGFSGNLGYTIPDEWCFDQFKTDLTIGEGDGKVTIDKVAVSGTDVGFYKNPMSNREIVEAFVKAFNYDTSVLDKTYDFENETHLFLVQPDSNTGNYVALNVYAGKEHNNNLGRKFSFEDGKVSEYSADIFETEYTDSEITSASIKASMEEFGYAVSVKGVNDITASAGLKIIKESQNPGAMFIYDVVSPYYGNDVEKLYLKMELVLKYNANVNYKYTQTVNQTAAQAEFVTGLMYAAIHNANKVIDYLNKLVEKLKIPDLKHPVLSYSMGFAELCCAILVIAAALAL